MVVQMVPDWAIFLYVQAIFISISFFESYADPVGWGRAMPGWRIKTPIRELTAYPFWSWLVMMPLFFGLPFFIFGWNVHVFWVILASYLIGTVIEDTLWFHLRPNFGMAKWNSQHADFHHWIKIGKFEVPEFVIIYPILAILIWWFLIRSAGV